MDVGPTFELKDGPNISFPTTDYILKQRNVGPALCQNDRKHEPVVRPEIDQYKNPNIVPFCTCKLAWSWFKAPLLSGIWIRHECYVNVQGCTNLWSEMKAYFFFSFQFFSILLLAQGYPRHWLSVGSLLINFFFYHAHISLAHVSIYITNEISKRSCPTYPHYYNGMGFIATRKCIYANIC